MDAFGAFRGIARTPGTAKSEFPLGPARNLLRRVLRRNDVKPTPGVPAQEARPSTRRRRSSPARCCSTPRPHLGRGQRPAAGATGEARRTSRPCSRLRGWRAAVSSPAMCSTSTPAGAITGKTPIPRSSTTPRVRASPTTRPKYIASKARGAGGARQSVHRSRGRRISRGQGAACAGNPARPAVRDPSPKPHSGGHPQHPETPISAPMAGDKVWLSCTIILPLRHARRVGIAGAPGRHRRGGAAVICRA